MPKTIKLLSTSETAQLLGISQMTVYRMLKDGRLTSYRKDHGKGNPHGITLDSLVGNIKL